MKRTSAALAAVAVLATVLAGCTTSAEYDTYDVAEWRSQLESTPGAFLLDVRTPEEYMQAHLANATLVPLQVLDRSQDQLPEDKDTPIFVYCRSGNRSAQAAGELVGMGYTDVRNLDGGILDWIDAGYPVA